MAEASHCKALKYRFCRLCLHRVGFPGIQWLCICSLAALQCTGLRIVPFVCCMQMLVPTVDTVRYSMLLETCLDVNRSVLFTGKVSGLVQSWALLA